MTPTLRHAAGKAVCIVALALIALFPLDAVSQETDRLPVGLVARLGLAEHDKGGAAYLGEVALRTREPIVFGVGLGFISTRSHTVGEPAPEPPPGAEWATISGGDAHFHSYRFRGLAGYAFDLGGPVWIETTMEGGFARESEKEETWQPWAVIALGARTDSGFAVQGGIGKHRVTTRYRNGSGHLVDEVHEWGTFSELLFSIPLI